MTNPYIEKFVLKRRSTFGSIMASIDLTGQFFSDYAPKTSMFLMAADQSPTRPDLAIWIPFLGVPTPCIHGVEKYHRKYKIPVVYAKISRKERGKYHVELSWLSSDLKNPEKGKLTYEYMKKLEDTILSNPTSWLWSHRRWKHIDKFPGSFDYPKAKELT